MHCPFGHRVTWLRSLLSAAVLLTSTVTSVLALGPYAAGSTGFDISYPQCSNPQPKGSFAIIGLNHGRAFSRNDCAAAQYQQAQAPGSPTTGQVSFYMNLNAAIGSTASNGSSGPMGKCKPSNKSCQAYNYGFNAAKDAYGYASTFGGQATVWWLDIETANSWQAQGTLNRQTILGAAEFLTANGRQVGVYSTQSMWNKITATWSTPTFPIWYAGTSSCTYAKAHAFTAGEVWLVQAGSGTDNGDLAC